MPSVVEEHAKRWATEVPAWLRARDWPGIRERLNARNVRLTVAAGLIVVLGLAAFAETSAATSGPVTALSPVAAANAEARRADAAEAPASRAERPETPASPESPAPPASPAPPPPPAQGNGGPAQAPGDDQKDKPKDDAAAQKPPANGPADNAAPKNAPAKLTPVAGLSQVQTENAAAIVRAGAKNGVPQRGMVIAVATAMQESTLLNRASEVVPESKQYPHQGTGWDHDSVGLFQQRSSSGWGPVASLMQPEYAATRFYEVLVQIPGWDQMPLTLAAQAVQVSAYPWAYADDEPAAATVVQALLQQGAANG